MIILRTSHRACTLQHLQSVLFHVVLDSYKHSWKEHTPQTQSVISDRVRTCVKGSLTLVSSILVPKRVSGGRVKLVSRRSCGSEITKPAFVQTDSELRIKEAQRSSHGWRS